MAHCGISITWFYYTEGFYRACTPCWEMWLPIGFFTCQRCYHSLRFLEMSLAFRAPPERLRLMHLHRKRGVFTQERNSHPESSHDFGGKKKKSYQFPLAWSSLIWRHSYSFPYSHHDILDAFLETVWEPRKNSRSPSSPTKKEEVDKKVLWCLDHLWTQQSIAALLGGRGMVQQQNTCTK